MLICQVLILRANHVGAVDSPRLERRLETVTYFRISIKLHLNDRFKVIVLGCYWLLLRLLLELGMPCLLGGLLERLYLHRGISRLRVTLRLDTSATRVLRKLGRSHGHFYFFLIRVGLIVRAQDDFLAIGARAYFEHVALKIVNSCDLDWF